MHLICTENYIDGSAFVELSSAEIKEMVPPIGLAKKIIKLLPKVGMNDCLLNVYFPMHDFNHA